MINNKKIIINAGDYCIGSSKYAKKCVDLVNEISNKLNENGYVVVVDFRNFKLYSHFLRKLTKELMNKYDLESIKINNIYGVENMLQLYRIVAYDAPTTSARLWI